MRTNFHLFYVNFIIISCYAHKQENLILMKTSLHHMSLPQLLILLKLTPNIGHEFFLATKIFVRLHQDYS